MTAKSIWKNFRKAFNALALRERKLVCMTSCIIVFSLFATLYWTPVFASWKKSMAANNLASQKIEQSSNEIEAIQYRSKMDPNKPFLSKLGRVKSKVTEQQKKIESITAALINPENMNQVFGTLLSDTELQINKIQNESAESVAIKEQDSPDNLLYKHALNLELKGTFKGSLKYLKRIEGESWRLYWDELIFKTSIYPQGILTLNVHTLSTSDHVLGL